eukprot:scaffold62299_cov45-Attheya_sp.AAC.1
MAAISQYVTSRCAKVRRHTTWIVSSLPSSSSSSCLGSIQRKILASPVLRLAPREASDEITNKPGSESGQQHPPTKSAQHDS